MKKLWEELLKPETIRRGWHLARADTRQDFSEDLYSTDVYGQDLDRHVQETINRIQTGTYQPRPLFRIEVPKGPLAFRPGTVIPIHDRAVLSAIVLLISSKIDKKLSNSVYSWRLKQPLPKSGPIFQETDITELPFLKKETIREKIDPFEGWYQLWPKFDEKTRLVFKKKGYRFLAISDIAAYFENIQLPILRDQLLKHLPNEAEIVNLLFLFLEAWVERTGDGRAHYRGIPQGNFVSSFLGNLFLMPLDEAFEDFKNEHDIEYFRYMDDVRVFTKTRENARLAVFLMARTLRELHLNVQTAKTRIYDENLSEISRLLIDPRVDELSDLIGTIQKEYGGDSIPAKKKVVYIKKIQDIAKTETSGYQKIIGARAPLEGLSLRCFNRWMTAHLILNSDYYIKRLLSEIAKSADYRLTRKLVSATRKFPKKNSIESSIMKMIKDGQIIFPYQEAECIRALRYLSCLNKDTINHCWKRLLDRNSERYLRMESAYLLSRIELDDKKLRKLNNKLDSEPDSYVQVSIASLLVQRREKNDEVVRNLVFHPNEKVRDIGKLFRTIKNNKKFAKDYLRHAFREEVPWMTCDCMPFIHLIANSKNRNILKMLKDEIRLPRKKHSIGGIRPILCRIYTRTRESLRNIE